MSSFIDCAEHNKGKSTKENGYLDRTLNQLKMADVDTNMLHMAVQLRKLLCSFHNVKFEKIKDKVLFFNRIDIVMVTTILR